VCAYSSCQFAFAITEDELEFRSPSVILCVSPYKIIPKSTHKYGQTERAEEQTLCRSCAVSPVCDTDTHTHTHTYTHTKHAALRSHVHSTHHTAICNTNIILNLSKGATRNTVGWSANNAKKRKYSGNLLNGLRKTTTNQCKAGIRIPQKARRPRNSVTRQWDEYWSCVDMELLQNRTKRTKWRIWKIVCRSAAWTGWKCRDFKNSRT